MMVSMAKKGARIGGIGPGDPDASAKWEYPLWLTILSMVGSGAGAYHGYKRNRDSIGWGFGWFVFGSMMPVFALPLMFAQGFGKPAKKS